MKTVDSLPEGVSDSVVISLPWPPSVNHYWRHVRATGRTIISAEGRAYRAQVAVCCRGKFGADRLAVEIMAMPPDRRRRDLDNLPKAILDALTYAGVWDDDSQIDNLRIVRDEVVVGGRVIVHVRRIVPG